jgi:hypothetical protein
MNDSVVELHLAQPTAVTHDDALDGPVTTLRGAQVEIDRRRLRQLFVGIWLVALAVSAALLAAAGANKNAEINALRTEGVPVTVTITGCLGDLGGTGGNQAGYTCSGRYQVDGRSYHADIPGEQLREPGSTVRAVAVPSDPLLISTAIDVASERTSGSVFVLPAVLAVLLLASLAVLGRRRARRR